MAVLEFGTFFWQAYMPINVYFELYQVLLD